MHDPFGARLPRHVSHRPAAFITEHPEILQMAVIYLACPPPSDGCWLLKDPVYGCVGAISVLRREVKQLQRES